MPLELNEEWAGAWLELRFSLGCTHQVYEQAGIEEASIRLTRFRSISGLFCLGGNGDLLPHLETHLEIFGNLFEAVPKLIRSRWPIEGGIVSDGAEQRLPFVGILAVLTQAFPCEGRLRIPPVIDLAWQQSISRPGVSS